MTNISDIKNSKNNQKLVCLTAYSFPVAKILDEFCDVILVGDSLGMAIYGMESTVGVSLEMMINHGKAVRKAVKNAFLVVDLPFGTYENSKEQALSSAQKVVVETGCDAIKIETTPELAETVKYLCDHKINVMAHVGLLPQRVDELGGYHYQGRDEKSAKAILENAKVMEKAGAFAMVIEAVPAKLAEEISRSVNIPTIGIGASVTCDGQVLVIDDLLGLNQEFTPKFVKKYADLVGQIKLAVKQFKEDVREQKFPGKENQL
jgi:3-methyl-2-oxobutanoate hydroxymethyltransferase